MKHILLTEGIASIIFLLLVIFMTDVKIANLIIILYSIIWIPAMCISAKIYNNILDSEENSEIE